MFKNKKFLAIIAARSGSKMLKTWGQNNGADNTTPSYIESDAVVGATYNFSVYGMTHADDKLKDKAKAWLQIKFFDSNWAEIPGGTSDTLDASSDTMKWHYLNTSATAPDNAAKVQAVIVHGQSAAYDGGSVYWDDAYFTTNSFTQIGVVTSKTLWAGDDSGVRGMAAGTDLDGDGKQEVWTTHYNNPGYKGGLAGD